MSKKFVRGICIVLCVLLLVGLIAYVLPTAFAVTQREIDQLEEERAQIRAAQTDLKEQIDALQGEISSVITRKAALDEQNELNRQDIELINEQIALYDEMISEKAVELDDARSAERAQYARYCERVRTMEEKNSWSYITMLLNASSLTDFLSRLNDVIDIVRNDQDVKAEYVAAREHVETVKAEYEEIQEGQQGKREELLTQKAALEKQNRGRLRRYRGSRRGHRKVRGRLHPERTAGGRGPAESTRRSLSCRSRRRPRPARGQLTRRGSGRPPPRRPAANRPSGTTVATALPLFHLARPELHVHHLPLRQPLHPIFQTTKYHSGVDIAAGYGSGDPGGRRRHGQHRREERFLRQLLCQSTTHNGPRRSTRI
jgi:peptidoglycan hydrolase CwlO-like protein